MRAWGSGKLAFQFPFPLQFLISPPVLWAWPGWCLVNIVYTEGVSLWDLSYPILTARLVNSQLSPWPSLPPLRKTLARQTPLYFGDKILPLLFNKFYSISNHSQNHRNSQHFFTNHSTRMKINQKGETTLGDISQASPPKTPRKDTSRFDLPIIILLYRYSM